MNPSLQQIQEALARLAQGEPVALPTETVYGLAADALNPLACSRIFEIKQRPLQDPLIVHLPDKTWLERLAKTNALALKLVDAFWPGPLTLVLPRTDLVPDIVTAGQSTVAVRMSAHPVFQAVITEYGKPLAAPSANKFGRISPTQASHVREELGEAVLILDAGPCVHGIESTIVLIEKDRLQIVRNGPITKEILQDFAPVVEKNISSTMPGSLKSHYAPRTPLKIGSSRMVEQTKRAKVGFLAWEESPEGFGGIAFLSERKNLREAAANLYAALRQLDSMGLELLVAEPVPEVGFGAAIMERLRKAAAEQGSDPSDPLPRG